MYDYCYDTICDERSATFKSIRVLECLGLELEQLLPVECTFGI